MNVWSPLSLAAAISIHAFILWGVKPEPAGVALATGEPEGTEVEVELFEAAPLAEEVSPPEPVVEPPPVEATPPEPEPEPTPPPIEEAMEEPEPAPEPPPPPKPQPRPVVDPAPKRKPAPAAPRAPSASPVGVAATGASGGGVGGSSDGSSRARWKHRNVPSYPSAAKNSGLHGSVQILVSVNALGQPSGARVLKSSGLPTLDEAALRAARSSTFHPKKVLGVPVPDTVIAPYTFRINR